MSNCSHAPRPTPCRSSRWSSATHQRCTHTSPAGYPTQRRTCSPRSGSWPTPGAPRSTPIVAPPAAGCSALPATPWPPICAALGGPRPLDGRGARSHRRTDPIALDTHLLILLGARGSIIDAVGILLATAPLTSSVSVEPPPARSRAEGELLEYSGSRNPMFCNTFGCTRDGSWCGYVVSVSLIFLDIVW